MKTLRTGLKLLVLMAMWRRLRDSILMAVFALSFWLYSRFWRVHRIRLPKINDSTPRIYAHWHGDELLLIPLFAHQKMAVLVSRSQDGELQRRLLGWFGYRTVRGSSSRGGVGGLKGLIDAVTAEFPRAAVAVDGPRGPIFKVKPGILLLAQQTGAVIIPGATAASRRFIFKKAWNRCYLPLPFSRCAIVYGEPFLVPPAINDSQFEALRIRLESQMLALKTEAEATFSREFHPAKLTGYSAVG